MANTTFKGPVVALNGFIGGANVNPHTGTDDTQQGGTNTWSVTDANTVTNGTDSLEAASNEGVMIYVDNGAAGAAVYAFSDGTNWKRCDTLANIAAA